MTPEWPSAGWVASGVALALAVSAGIADRRRRNRRDLDRIGWIDWRSVQMLALIVALLCAAAGWRG